MKISKTFPSWLLRRSYKESLKRKIIREIILRRPVSIVSITSIGNSSQTLGGNVIVFPSIRNKIQSSSELKI